MHDGKARLGDLSFVLILRDGGIFCGEGSWFFSFGGWFWFVGEVFNYGSSWAALINGEGGRFFLYYLWRNCFDGWCCSFFSTEGDSFVLSLVRVSVVDLSLKFRLVLFVVVVFLVCDIGFDWIFVFYFVKYGY